MPAKALQPQEVRRLGIYGVIRETEVDDYSIPDEAVTEAINVHFDRKGAVTLRPGITTLGSSIAIGYPCWGLHNTQNGTMIAVFSEGGSSRIYAYGGSSWASNLTNGTANVKIRFVNFAGRTIVLNWGTATNMYSSMQFWANNENNATWVSTGNPINPQNIWSNGIYPKYGEVYKSRVYICGDPSYPSRLWWSSVISSSGNITWDPSTDYVDINPDDGENFTGLKRFSLELLVFKPNYIYRFRTSEVDPDPLIKIGTRSNESIIEGKRGLYFHHDSGFYRYSGSYPQEISRPISDIVKAISFSSYSNICSWKDEDHIYWSVGDITINGSTWSNVICRYTESSEIWTVYSYANNIKLASDYNSGSALSRVVGLDNGVVATFDSGTSDLGEPIKYRLITKWYEWDGVENQKIIQRLISVCEKAQGSKLMYQVDGESKWETIGQLKKFLTDFDNQQIKFHRIRFKLTGISSVEAFVWLGLKIVKGINEGIVI